MTDLAPRTGILIVDDNATNLRLAEFCLRATGQELRTAASAAEALATLASFRPAVIVMDLQMPDVDGFELTRRLRADVAHASARILALTAFAMKGDEERARAAGCDAYLAKPVLPDALRRAVAAQLAAAADAAAAVTAVTAEESP